MKMGFGKLMQNHLPETIPLAIWRAGNFLFNGVGFVDISCSPLWGGVCMIRSRDCPWALSRPWVSGGEFA